MRKTIGLITLLAVSAGCSFIARGDYQYRADTRTLLESRNGAIVSCYDNALSSAAGASGDVVVQFTVEKKTGALTNITAAEGSTASEPLQNCVLNALEGLTLTPEDRRDGDATFTYTFSPPAGAV